MVFISRFQGWKKIWRELSKGMQQTYSEFIPRYTVLLFQLGENMKLVEYRHECFQIEPVYSFTITGAHEKDL